MQTTTTTTSTDPRTASGGLARRWARLRRAGRIGAAAAAVAALTIATPAAAAQPTTTTETFDETYDVPAEAFPCGVDVTFRDAGTVRDTYFEEDGELVRVIRHYRVTTTVTSAHAEVVNRWGGTAILDVAAGTIAISGNVDNVHAGAGGVIVNGSGRTVEDAVTEELLFAAGPLERIDDNWDALCAALTP